MNPTAPQGSLTRTVSRTLALKGSLRPDDASVHVERAFLSPRFDELARQVWVPRWNIKPGLSLRVPVLQYPAVNIAVEASSAACYLPIRGVGSRTLTGVGWAAGLLLRPGAGVLVVHGNHASRLGAELPIPHGEALVSALRERFAERGTTQDVVDAYERWLEPMMCLVNDEVRLVNAIVAAVESDSSLKTTRNVVERFQITERGLQRLLARNIGLTPRWLIKRRRLQESAHRIQTETSTPLATIALEAGYADQSHFTREFRAVVGFAPSEYKRRVTSHF
jgi:AraC-like DNA-binding protein